MRFTDALRIIQDAPKDGMPFEVTLACGFTPLHLQTFLGARLQQALPKRRVKITTGLYGSLARTIEQITEVHAANLVVVLEWSDLDARLGYRAFAVWDDGTLPDILSSVRRAFERLAAALQRAMSGTKIALSTPTLALPPFLYNPSWQAGDSESSLRQMAAEFEAKMAALGVLVVDSTYLSEESPPSQRYDLKSDLLLGLPHTQVHADKLAEALARLLCPPTSKKGIITDLDDTLWSGLVGEVGPEGVRWDLDSHSGMHALYQRLLGAFVSRGILVGVASKNEASVVAKVFERRDLLLDKDRVFPMEVHWHPKSNSVERILHAWNISADAVVFVDDSAMELAEVAAAHPGIERIQFPAKDYAAGYGMLRKLRDLFGKQQLLAEDHLRIDSIREATKFQEGVRQSDPESFLQEIAAKVHFDFESSQDARAFELVNKTNQFNLNGIRYTEADWALELSQPQTVLSVISYEDKFGLLGKIAVLMGRLDETTLRVRTWVMSCRAFTRRIEYQCLKACFDRFGVQQLEFEFLATEKNKLFQDFLAQVTGQNLDGIVRLTREQFESSCPALYHAVKEAKSEYSNG